MRQSQVRILSLKPEDAVGLLAVVRFLRDTPGAEALGIAYTAAYLRAAPGKDIGAEGQDLPNTPRNAFSLWSTYKVLPELTLGGGAYYVDKVYGNADAGVDASGAPKARWVPSYWRFDAMAKYKFSSHLALQLNVLNVFDQTFYTRARPKNHAT